ncbi:MAG: hypothetical protein HUU35_12750, partial [Armatimonadetes bacterium]|nr:hypothetical protein [Armatimonadota bacterium]
ARQSSCQSNHKQIGIAYMQYCQDYDEVWVRAAIYYAAPAYYTWPYIIQPYMKSNQIMTCPSATAERYAGVVNATTTMGTGMFSQLSSAALASLRAPASLIAAGDSGRLPPPTYSNQTYYLIDWDGEANIDNAPPPEPRHNEGANMIFADGHAKWLSKTAYGDFTNASIPLASMPYPEYWTP